MIRTPDQTAEIIIEFLLVAVAKLEVAEGDSIMVLSLVEQRLRKLRKEAIGGWSNPLADDAAMQVWRSLEVYCKALRLLSPPKGTGT